MALTSRVRLMRPITSVAAACRQAGEGDQAENEHERHDQQQHDSADRVVPPMEQR
jgi:hypothetical protein